MALVHLTMYRVSRCYGGPEEGGWYYDHWERVPYATLIVDEDDEPRVERARKLLMQRYGWKNAHSRSSVLGGDDCEIIMENSLGEYASKERPHYE